MLKGGAAWRGEQLRARIGRPKPTGVPGDRAMAQGFSDGIKKSDSQLAKKNLARSHVTICFLYFLHQELSL